MNTDSASAAAAEPLTHPLADRSPDPLADPVADPLIGQVLEDRYKIDRILGTGGMGKVYLATNLNTEKPYAIKVMHSELLHNEDAQKRFTREARAISAIAHPHIVELYDFGQTPSGLPFLVMEYLVGTSLRTYLDDTKSGLPLSQALCVAMQIARALQHVHERGIIHRDIKPDNIHLIASDEQAIFAKLIDFGIARIQSQAPVTQISRGLPSTWAYAPPEVHHGAVEPSPAIDIYALGITLYEIITAHRPFSGEALAVVWAHLRTVPPRLSESKPGVGIPEDLDVLVAQMLAKDPKRRPTAGEVAETLEVLSTQLPSVSDARMYQLRTYVLPGNQRADAPKADAPGKEEQRNLAQILNAAREIDQIESERERVCAQLDHDCQGLLQRNWLKQIPQDLSELLRRSADIEEKMSSLELDLALLHDELAQEKEKLQEQRNSLRLQLQAVQDELRSLPATDWAARREAAQLLARLEHAYAQPVARSTIAERVHQEGIRRQQLREELLGSQKKVAERLLRTIRESGRGRINERDSQDIALRAQGLMRGLTRLEALNESLRRF
ncbi:MAG TPA: protein kinase [Pseudomonadota bacterium]|nr:protein kinase [Pseudomonadota bacterium]